MADLPASHGIPPPTPEPRLVSVAEAARILGMSRRWTAGAVKRHLIPSLKCGRSRRIDVRDLLEFIEKNKSTNVTGDGRVADGIPRPLPDRSEAK